MTLSPTDARGRLAAFHRKENEARLERQRLEAEAAQQAAAERQQALEVAERARLERMRKDRLTLEAYNNLSEAERAAFEARTNSVTNARRLADQALSQATENFNRQNEAQRQQEMTDWRSGNQRNTTALERANALQQINARAQERAEAFKKQLDDFELKAEQHSDPVQRIIHSLPPDARAIMSQLVDAQPTAAQHIEAVKQESAQQQNAAKQAELRAAYEAEVVQARGNLAWKFNIRQKYRDQGLEV